MRKGFAVLLAIFAIVLFGAIATAMVFAASEETKASGSLYHSTRVLAAAEDATWKAAGTIDWNSAALLRPGQSIALPVTASARAQVHVVRLDSTCFFIQAVSNDAESGALNGAFVRRVGLTIEVTPDSTGVLRPSRVPDRAWTELF